MISTRSAMHTIDNRPATLPAVGICLLFLVACGSASVGREGVGAYQPAQATAATGGGGGAVIPRTVSFRLDGATLARGRVEADANRRPRRKACSEDVPVNIQRRRDGRWDTVATGTTNDNARYRITFPERRGTYRAEAEAVLLDPALCDRVFSRTVTVDALR